MPPLVVPLKQGAQYHPSTSHPRWRGGGARRNSGGMELSLTRQELLQVSSTCRKTMRLLPLGKKKQQKVKAEL